MIFLNGKNKQREIFPERDQQRPDRLTFILYSRIQEYCMVLS